MREHYWTAPDCYLGLVSPHNSSCWWFLSPEPNWWEVIWTSGQALWIRFGSSTNHRKFLFLAISKQHILFCWHLEYRKGFSSIELVQSLKSCPTLWESMDCSMADLLVLHYLLEFVQIHSWTNLELFKLITLSWWCHLTTSSSVIPFSYPQSFPASGSFPHTHSKENASVLPCLWTKANCMAHLQFKEFMLLSRSGVQCWSCI